MTTTQSPLEEARSPRRTVVTSAVAVGLVMLATAPLPYVFDGTARTGQVAAWRIGAAVVAAAIAAMMAAFVARGRRWTERIAWTLIAFGNGAWVIGSTIWVGHLAAGRTLPAPGPADVFYVLFPLSWCVAVVLLSRQDGTDARRARHVRTLDVLDSAIVALAMLLVVWVSAFRATGLSGTDRSALLTMLYPVMDAVLLTLLVRAVRRTTVDRRALGLLAVGVAWCTVGDLGYLLDSHVAPLPGLLAPILDSAWVVGFAVIAGGSWIALGGREATPPRGRRASRGAFQFAVGGFAAVIGLVDLTRHDGTAWTVAILVAVMLLLLARQSLTLRENRRLSSELVQRVRDLEHQATHDALTSLPNREHLEQRLHGLIATGHIGAGSAVMFLDIDLLKPINDSLGHAFGDRLIRTVAGRLRERWGDDVVRFGGDEFVVLLRHVGSIEEIQRTAERLVDEMHEPVTTSGVTLQPSVSVGVAPVGPDSTPEELLRRSDLALYHAKSLGRRRAALFEESMDGTRQRTVVIAPQLRRAIDEGQFELHYQPVVDLMSGRVRTAEALLRWHHPDLGLIGPDAFLDEADALGLMGELGRRSLLEATTRFADLNATRTRNPVRVTVNLSAGELDSNAVADVDDALRESRLDPSLLVLEITEDVIVDASIRRALSDLRRIGVGIAIDDFGTGNSSLRQLGEYPASVLKVDRSFVEGITGADGRFIVGAILDLATRLGLDTVAEGVETVEQARVLAELGCEHAQGWLFERAVPFDRLVHDWLDEAGPSDEVREVISQIRPSMPVQRRRRAASAPSMIRSSSTSTVGSSSITPTT